MRTGFVCARRSLRAFGSLFAVVLLTLTANCGDAPLIFGPIVTVQEVDVREGATIPIPGGGTLTILPNSTTAPTNPGLIVSNRVTMVLSRIQDRTPQDTLDENKQLVKNAFTGLISFGPAGLKFSPPATACFVFVPEEGLDPMDAQIFWTNQGTTFFAPITPNDGYPRLNDTGEGDTNSDDWIVCGDVRHFSRGYVGDIGLDPNGEELVIGDPDTFFSITQGSYDYTAIDLNLTGDGTWVHGGNYTIDVTSDGITTVPVDLADDLVFDFNPETDTFDASVFETNVIIVRDGWQLTINQPLIPPGPVNFTVQDVNFDMTGIAWRFDPDGPTGMEGPLGNQQLGFIPEGSPYEGPITAITNTDSGVEPDFSICIHAMMIEVDEIGMASVQFGNAGPTSVKGGGPIDYYEFPWDFDPVNGTQVPPAMTVDTSVVRTVTWCEPDCAAATRDEFTLEFTDEVFSAATLELITATGSISYDLVVADVASCSAP